MRHFDGFPAGRTRFTPIPDLFFTELLATIDDLDELRVVLFMFWSLNRQRGYPRYMMLEELEGESILIQALAPEGLEGEEARDEAIEALHRALERCVKRGALLRMTVINQEREAVYFFANTPQGRKAVRQVREGELVLETTGYVREARLPVAQKANIFELYERNIGLLQPVLADELREAEDTYPADWIVDAFRIAAEGNARRWSYIRSILERWEREGKDDGSRLSSSRDRRYNRNGGRLGSSR